MFVKFFITASIFFFSFAAYAETGSVKIVTKSDGDCAESCYGDLEGEGRLVDGKRTGHWKFYYKSTRKLHSKGFYHQGKRTGSWRFYMRPEHKNHLANVGEFRNDKKFGKWTNLAEGKRAQSYEDFKKDGKTVVRLSVRPNGEPWIETTKVLKGGKWMRHGTYTTWKKGGGIDARSTYKNGELSGPYVWFWPNGLKKRSGEYKNGKSHGFATEWRRDGSREGKGFYKDRLRTGKWTFWHANGKKASNGVFKKGKKEGTWTYWHRNGKKASSGKFTQAKKVGKWKYWDENGKVTEPKK